MNSSARKYRTIKHWCRLPGIGLIRAETIFAYLDTPWRFKKKSKLHKYCGIGLEGTTSGTDNKGRIKPGDVVNILTSVNHWNGATKDS